MKKMGYLKMMGALAALTTLAVGCIADHAYTPASEQYSYEKFKQTDVLSVDVPKGKAAVVTFESDTLYVLTASEQVMVPYVPTDSRSRAATDNPIVVSYIDLDAVTDNVKYSVWGDLPLTIAFEDTKSGDYDYNDLVLHIRLGKASAQSKGGISVQPVALGSSRVLGLGAYIKEANTNKTWRVVLSEDVRRDFFEGKTGFINTANETGEAMKKWYKFNIIGDVITNNMLKVNWFILAGNEELFAVSDDFYKKSVDAKGRPYGLVFTNIHGKYNLTYGGRKGGSYGTEFFWYPRERTNISEAYPRFEELFDTSSSITLAEVFGEPVMENCVKVMSLFKDADGVDCFDNNDNTNLYFVRPNTGYFYYDNGGTLDVVSMDAR